MYMSRCKDLPVLCAEAAKRNGVLKFIEISTGYIYKSHSRTAPIESEEPSPHGKQAEAKRAAEVALLKMSGIDIIIVRPAVVYGGSGDVNGVLFGRVICASCYTSGSGSVEDKGERLPTEMTVLWDRHMKVNTIHVKDVARAVWHLYREAGGRTIWNLCDSSDTDQGKVIVYDQRYGVRLRLTDGFCAQFGSILERIFHIKIGYFGSFRSNIAKYALSILYSTR